MSEISIPTEVLDEKNLVVLDAYGSLRLDSAIPYYYQLFDYMRAKINSKQWKVGQKLPSEQMLCSYFGVSRTVVRQALNELANDNLIVTYKGRGSFVASKKNVWEMMKSDTSFFEYWVSHGQNVSSIVLEMNAISALDEIASSLEVPDGTPAIKLRRLRYVDREPVVVVNSYIPERLCPNLVNEDLSDKSLYRLLSDKYGLKIAHCVRTIESINATSKISELLCIPIGSALILLKNTSRLADGTPLEYFISWHRGDRSRFTFQLINPLD